MSTSSVALAEQLVQRRIENGMCSALAHVCASLILFESRGLMLGKSYGCESGGACDQWASSGPHTLQAAWLRGP